MSSMKNILYVGNALSHKGKTKTSVETLGTFLCEFCNVKTASNKTNKVLRLLDMVRLVLKNSRQSDYVLIDTYSTSNYYFALVISQLCRCLNLKYIPILHGGNLENRLIKNPRYSKLIFKNAYRLISPSQFLEKVFQKYNYDNILYIPNTINLNSYSYVERDIDSINLLWVRSFASIYNPEQAVLVLEKLLELNYDASLTMIGPDVDGSLAKVKNLEKQKNLKVNFTGKLTKSQWVDVSKDCNIFINTTNFDNTPVSVIEAMALGLPVVSTDVGGMPYLISDNYDGILVPPKDVSAMTNAIVQLKTDNVQRVKLVSNARTKVENYSWNVVKHMWVALLS